MDPIRRTYPSRQASRHQLSLLPMYVQHNSGCPTHQSDHAGFNCSWDMSSLLLRCNHHAWRWLHRQRPVGPQSRPSRSKDAPTTYCERRNYTLPGYPVPRRAIVRRSCHSAAIPMAMLLLRHSVTDLCGYLPADEARDELPPICPRPDLFLGRHDGFPSSGN